MKTPDSSPQSVFSRGKTISSLYRAAPLQMKDEVKAGY